MEKMKKMEKPHIKGMSTHGCAGHRRYMAASIEAIRAAFDKRLKEPRSKKQSGRGWTKEGRRLTNA